MHGQGRYSFTSGAVYSGAWAKGKMSGRGQMSNPDGTGYTGEWENGLMHGEGCYTDKDRVQWEGIFINGSYDSKVQKRIKEEKVIQDKIKDFQAKARNFFTSFAEAFAKSDKKTFKDNLGPFFATADLVGEHVSEPYCKYEERAPDKWNELIKQVWAEGNCTIKALQKKEHAQFIKPEAVLAQQLGPKRNGQIVECESVVNDKTVAVVLCLVNEQWVLLAAVA